MKTLNSAALFLLCASAASAAEVKYDIAANGPAEEAASWQGGTAPSADDTAVFQSTAVSQWFRISFNESVAWRGIYFDSSAFKDFQPEFGESGASTAITLGVGGISTSTLNNKTTRFYPAIHLGADQTWTLNSGTFMFWSPTQLNGHTLTIAGGSTKELRSDLLGPGTIHLLSNIRLFPGYCLDGVDLIANNPTTSYAGPEFQVGSEARLRAQSVTLRNAGQLVVSSTSSATPGVQSIGDLTQDGGNGKVRLSQTKAGKLIFSAARYVNQGGITLFSGNSLGVYPLDSSDAVANTNIRFEEPPTLLCGLLPGAILDYGGNLSIYRGVGFATYDDTYGVRALPEEEYSPTLTEGTHVRLINTALGAQTNTLDGLLSVKSLSIVTTNNPNAETTLPSGVTINGNGPLRVESGMMWFNLSTPSPTADDGIWLDTEAIDLAGSSAYIFLRQALGYSNGESKAPVHLAADLTNVGANGVSLSGNGIVYLDGNRPLTYSGIWRVGTGAFLRLTKTETDSLKGTFILDGGTIQCNKQLDDNEADVIIHAGSMIVKKGASNSGNSGDESFRDLTMTGGSFLLAGGGSGSSTIRQGVLAGGSYQATRGTIFKIGQECLLGGTTVTLAANTEKARNGTRMECVGKLTISNSVTGGYIPLSMGYSRYNRLPGLILHDEVDVIGNATAQAPVEVATVEDTDPAGVSAQVQLDGTIPFTVTRNSLSSVDFRLHAGVTNAPAEYNLTGEPGRLVKRGDGILELAAASNGLTGGVLIEEGRLNLAGTIASSVEIASGGALGVTGAAEVAGAVSFAKGASFHFDLGASLTASGDIAAEGEVETFFSIPEDKSYKQLVLKATNPIEAKFTTSAGEWKLLKKANGTEVWLTAVRGSVIIVH